MKPLATAIRAKRATKKIHRSSHFQSHWRFGKIRNSCLTVKEIQDDFWKGFRHNCSQPIVGGRFLDQTWGTC